MSITDQISQEDSNSSMPLHTLTKTLPFQLGLFEMLRPIACKYFHGARFLKVYGLMQFGLSLNFFIESRVDDYNMQPCFIRDS